MRYYDNTTRKTRLIGAAVLAVGCLAFAGFQLFNNAKAQDQIDSRLSLTYEHISDEEYIEEIKTIKSDIKGMSRYDKLNRGLMVEDGSDSDFDGLSDKDEIEKYGTDPLKASTSGDLYTDGYKAAHDMKFTKKYDYKGKISFAGNKCKEIILDADDALDMSAEVRDITKSVLPENIDTSVIYKVYKLYNYSGSIKLRTNLALPSDVKTDDVSVGIFEGSFLDLNVGEIEKVEHEDTDGNIVPQYDFAFGKIYYIILSKNENIDTLISSMFGGKANDETTETGVGLFITSPILGGFSKFQNFTDYLYSEMSDTDSTYKFRNKFLKKINSTLFERYDEDLVTPNSENLTKTSKSDILFRYNLLKSLLKPFEYDGEEPWYQIFFTYSFYDYETGKVISSEEALGRNGDKEDRKNFKKYHTDFDQYEDVFSFQNFGSEIAPNGNCLGITHFLSYLYNTGSYPSSGSYKKISWDISKDKENKTLLDPGVFDFKNIHFVDDKSDDNCTLIPDELSSGEKEFVKMIGAAWKEGNDIIHDAPYIKKNGELNSYSTLEKVIEYIDQGKVVCANMYMNDGGAHSIILYDYFWTDEESISFRVYDCNFPQNDRENAVLSESNGTIYFRCNVVTKPNGKKYFEYLYYPLKTNKSYMSASSGFLMDTSCIEFTDESWNIFNKK